MNRDLTIGNPQKILWKFCLPLFASVIFQQLYNIADSFVAGKFISNDALAAVGNSYEITLIFIAFAFGCNIGCSVIVSKMFGAKNYSDVKTAVYTTFVSVGILCGILVLLGLIFSKKLLLLIQTPQNIFEDSLLYLKIYIFGLPFVFFYNIATGIFSALGDSKTPFYFLVGSSLSNIAVDILFVSVFKMGVAGVAWATFICQGISCCLALLFVLKRLKNLPADSNSKIFSFPVFCQIAKIAIPSIFQQSFISVGNIIIQGLINGFDSSAVIAGYSASIKLNNMVTTSLTTLGNGISNYSSQNLGANKLDRIRKGFFVGWKMVWTICLPITLLYLFFGNSLVYLFLESPSGEAMDVGVQILRILSPFYVVISLKMVSDGILRGVGKMTYFMIGTFTGLFLRVVVAYFLSKTSLGITGIWASWPIGWVISAIVSISLLFSTSVMKKSQKNVYCITKTTQ